MSTVAFQGFPSGSVVKNPPAKAGKAGSIPGSGRSPRGYNGNPLQYSCWENSIDGDDWRVLVHGVAKVGHDCAHVHNNTQLYSKVSNGETETTRC